MFPRNGILDNFNRSNEGPPPSANWGNWTNGIKVVSSQVKGNVADNNRSYWNVLPFGPDCEVHVTIYRHSGGWIHLFVRMASSGNGYAIQVEKEGSTASIYKLTNWSHRRLGGIIDNTVSDGDSYGLEIVGNILKAYKKPLAGSWSLLGTRTDSTYLGAGYIGLGIYDVNSICDDFGGGNLRGATLWPVIFYK